LYKHSILRPDSCRLPPPPPCALQVKITLSRRYSTPANCPLAGSLEQYLETLAAAPGDAPKPLPVYAQKHGWRAGVRKKYDAAASLLQV